MPSAASPLRELAQRAQTATAHDLWRRLPAQVRADGLTRALQGPQKDRLRVQLRHCVAAEQKGFRFSTVASWDDAELSKYARRLVKPPESLISDVLAGFYVSHDTSVQVAFFDALGIPHHNGLPADLQVPAAPDERVASVLGPLLERLEWSDVTVTYFLALAIFWAEHWPHLAAHLERAAIIHPLPEVTGDGAENVSDSDAHDENAQDLESTRSAQPGGRPRESLVAIDHAITSLIIRSVGEADGAPPSDAMAAVVEQFIRINPERKQSLFQLGLLDGLLGRQPADVLVLENAPRRRWYTAGWVTARARLPDYESIAAQCHSESPLLELGDGAAATELAAPQIAESLFSADRHAELIRFLKPAGVLACGFSFASNTLLGWAIALLRKDDITQAKPYLRLLEDVAHRGIALGQDDYLDILPDIQRRLAHCMRLEGDFTGSRALLDRLLETSLPGSYRAMVLADIGLMECGFNRLSAIPIPADRLQAADLVERIGRGALLFEQVAAIDASERSHGEYPLGIRLLFTDAQANADQALERLERSAFSFQANAERYQVGGLIERANFLVGLAGVLAEGAALRTEHYARLIVHGYDRGYRLPEFLLPDVLVHLALKSPPAAVELVGKLIALGEERDLEAIEQLEFSGAELIVARAQFDSACRLGKATPDVAKRLRRALTLAWQGAEHDRDLALRILDRLFDLALAGVAAQEFVDVLQDAELVSGLWDPDEILAARLRLLERSGAYVEATALLTQLFHRLLSDGGHGCISEAEEVLAKIREYGVESEGITSALKARLEGAKTGVAPPTPPSVDFAQRYAVTIGVIGGDERQRQYEERLKEWARQADVNISLHFIYSGWTSNWGDYVADFKRLMPRLDGIVLLRFTRTEFGRTVRATWTGGPQIGTWGHGEQRIKLAVSEVAAMVRARHGAEGAARS